MKKILFSAITIALLFLSNVVFSQTPNGTANLGILTSFGAYTGAGGVANGSGASFTGDVGTNIGIISGFGAPPNFIGNTYNANATTAQARFDLFRFYIHLNDKFVDFPGTHAPAFGGGETLTPGVYSIPAAGSIGGALTLDGGGNPNAFFIIKWGGALTAGAGATITLTGGTQSCNVFFMANGAVSVAADANLKGTLFAKIGAVGIGAGTVLEGRMLSMEGAITTGVGAIVRPPSGTCTIPIFCESGCSPASSVDVLGVLTNYALFTNLGAVSNTSTSGINGKIATESGASSGYESSIVIGSFETANAATAQAKTDIDNAYIALMALPNTVTSHAAAFGIGETINAGVYFVNGAGSLGGTITLDAQNNPNAIFVFKFAGAFGIAAQSKIILANGARRCNVFWIGGAGVATGAVSIGAASELKGTFLSHGGACTSGAGLFLSGRLLSTGGAVTTYAGIVYNNPECVTSTSLGMPVILAVADTTTAVNGSTGGVTTSLTLNDRLGGVPVVIGTAPGDVTLSGVTVPTGLTLNANGTVTVAPNTAAGNYSLTYKICEVTNPTNCSTATSKIVVAAPAPAGTLDCAKTQIIQAPVQGVPNQVTLVVTMNVTTAGNFPVTLSGSGMSLANGVTYVTTTTTGVQTFNIPMKYDGTTLGTLTFTVGSNTCTADLSLTKKKVLIDVWILDNCTLKIAAPALK
ncbi:ice-binding family protein [Flavobacterium sp.]|uniref:ice-binding family protein n=1 Tax=Flavobacterium sp. TaxID=239 RepID=UPI0037503E53